SWLCCCGKQRAAWPRGGSRGRGLGCGPAAPPKIFGGAVAAVRGFVSHRSTGYQRISAGEGLLPATLRAQVTTDTRPSPLPHSFGALALSAGARGSWRCVVSCSDTLCRAEPENDTTPSVTGTTRARQFVEHRLHHFRMKR